MTFVQIDDGRVLCIILYRRFQQRRDAPTWPGIFAHRDVHKPVVPSLSAERPFRDNTGICYQLKLHGKYQVQQVTPTSLHTAAVTGLLENSHLFDNRHPPYLSRAQQKPPTLLSRPHSIDTYLQLLRSEHDAVSEESQARSTASLLGC